MGGVNKHFVPLGARFTDVAYMAIGFCFWSLLFRYICPGVSKP